MVSHISLQPSRARTAVGPDRGKVLVVDDDPHFRLLARTMLEPAGFEVLESEDVARCMSRLRSEAVDALILDMVMPGQDGIEAVRELKRLYPEVRILAVSGAEQGDLYLSISQHLGADASLEKARIGTLCPLLQLVLER